MPPGGGHQQRSPRDSVSTPDRGRRMCDTEPPARIRPRGTTRSFAPVTPNVPHSRQCELMRVSRARRRPDPVATLVGCQWSAPKRTSRREVRVARLLCAPALASLRCVGARRGCASETTTQHRCRVPRAGQRALRPIVSAADATGVFVYDQARGPWARERTTSVPARPDDAVHAGDAARGAARRRSRSRRTPRHERVLSSRENHDAFLRSTGCNSSASAAVPTISSSMRVA